MDAGGTFFKAALVNSLGECLDGTSHTLKVDPEGPAEVILSAYRQISRHGAADAGKLGMKLDGVGVATPGPFNFEAGRSLMLHKFRSLYNYNLKAEIRLDAKCKDVFFIHDVLSFLLGESWRGAGRGYERIAAVTLGTGLGFGCMSGGKPLKNSMGSPHISLYKEPVYDGIAEDYVSRRGILQAYRRMTGKDVPDLDVAGVAKLARDGQDKAAGRVFHETGQILGKVLAPVLKELSVQCLILGGQISKSADLMMDGLAEQLEHVPCLERVTPAKHIDTSSLIGAAKMAYDSR